MERIGIEITMKINKIILEIFLIMLASLMLFLIWEIVYLSYENIDYIYKNMSINIYIIIESIMSILGINLIKKAYFLILICD